MAERAQPGNAAYRRIFFDLEMDLALSLENLRKKRGVSQRSLIRDIIKAEIDREEKANAKTKTKTI